MQISDSNNALKFNVCWLCRLNFNAFALSHWTKLILTYTQPVKIDLNKNLDPKQKTIQTFNINAKRFIETKNENPQTLEIGIASKPVPANLPTMGRLAGTG